MPKSQPNSNEALSMVCAQVIGNNVQLIFLVLKVNFELNTFKPVIAYNIFNLLIY